MKLFAALLLLSVLLVSLALPACALPVRLQVEHQTQPLAIDQKLPRFAWQSSSTEPNWRQSAYRIAISTEHGRLSRPDVWDSGRTASSRSLDIAYGGPALAPATRYLWQVRTWDAQGRVSVSAPASFETAPADIASGARWIRPADPAGEKELAATHWLWLPQKNANTDALHVAPGQQAEFRYTLHLDRAPRSASLHVIAKGDYVATVNGTESGRHTGWSAFDFEPITHLLRAGDNEIVVHLSAEKNTERASSAAFAASIRVTDADGEERRTGSADNWQARTGGAPWQAAAVLGPLSLPFSTGVDRHSPLAGPDRIATEASLLRKRFTLAARPVRARLFITALGSYRAYLNGVPVAAETLLDPGFTDFNKRILYQTYDVTALLRAGNNTLGAMLGGGWHGSPLTWGGTRAYGGPDLLLARLDFTLANGQHQVISTDSTWQTAAAPILSAEIYAGEVYDARRELPNWSAASPGPGAWSAAVVAPAPPAALTAQPDLSIRQTGTLHPVSIHKVGDAYVVDMGQNMVGNIGLHLSGARGTTVRMRYAERLNPDGSVYLLNLRNAVVTDYYTLRGGAPESWTPAFTFHGFRYVELTGFPGVPNAASIEGLVQNSLPAQPSLRFQSSSSLLNSMATLGLWGQRGNFVSIPTDCPQRDERLGWMGDAGVFWRTGTYNFDIASFTEKFMQDILDAQQDSGNFTDVSPDVVRWGDGAPGWADAGILVPYAAWLQYGDTATLERAWARMNRYMDFIAAANPGMLRVHHVGNNFADWLAPDPNTPPDLIDTAYWALLARQMRQMSAALHDSAHEALYAALFDRIRAAYNTAYIHADGAVAGNTQSAYVVTLYAGLEPDPMRENMVQRLVQQIAAHGDHLTTGFLGTPFLLPVLDENHHADLAFKLLLEDTYPSWGYMVAKGATTWWERWNGDTGDPSMNSYNHYAFGSVMAWVYRRAAGIDSTDGSGFQHLAISPHFDPALPQLHTEYDSPYGIVTTDWKDRRFSVELPPNTTATLTLPGRPPVELGSGTSSYQVAADR